MYDYGEAVVLDDGRALALYRQAPEQENVGSQFNLAVMYDNGEGVAEDTAEAVQWYLKAAVQEHAEAQYYLALKYDYGEGVRWYLSAAELGCAGAQYNLGAMYYTGEGTAVDYLGAYMWSVISVAQGKEEAQGNIDIIVQQLTASQVSETKERSWLWRTDHDRQNSGSELTLPKEPQSSPAVAIPLQNQAPG